MVSNPEKFPRRENTVFKNTLRQLMFTIVFFDYCWMYFKIFLSSSLVCEVRGGTVCLKHKFLVICLTASLNYVYVSLEFDSTEAAARGSVRKGVLRNFGKFTGKHLCQSLFFNKVVGLRPATLLKKRLWHRCFPVNFAKSLRTPFLQNMSGQLLLSKMSKRRQIELVSPGKTSQQKEQEEKIMTRQNVLSAKR